MNTAPSATSPSTWTWRPIATTAIVVVVGIAVALVLSYKPGSTQAAAGTSLPVLGGFEHTNGARTAADWDERMEFLADLGYTEIASELVYGGYAHYESAFMEESANAKAYGDQIAYFVDAAHAHGMEAHVAKVVFNITYGRSSGFINDMRAQDRLMQRWNSSTQQTEEMLWLSPAHPANLQLNKDVVLELVSNYDIDGVMLDYVRYPGDYTDFSTTTRNAFEAHMGLTIDNWPQDVLPNWRTYAPANGPYYRDFEEWKAQVITDHVADLYAAVKAIKPHVKVTADVFSNPDSSYAHGQDWRRWLELEIIDAVYPMNYTLDNVGFGDWLAMQIPLSTPERPIYPLLRVDREHTSVNRDILAEQVRMVEDAGFGGLMVWQLHPNLFPSSTTVCENMVPNFAACDAGYDELVAQEPDQQEPVQRPRRSSGVVLRGSTPIKEPRESRETREAEVIACHQLKSGDSVRVGLGVPWNTLSSTRELLLSATCGTTSATVLAGNGSDTLYIYERGYVWKNGQWQPITFQGERATGSWITGSASATLSFSERELTREQYVVSYMCQMIGTTWKCGCSDNACTVPAWQLQTIKK